MRPVPSTAVRVFSVRRRLVVSWVLCTAVHAPLAWAQPAEPDPGPEAPPEAQEDEARVHFERAKELYRIGNLQGAEVELLRAQALRPSYKLHRTLGELREQMHEYAESIDSFERYLHQGADLIDEADRADVLARVERLRTFVGWLEVHANQDGAELLIDGVRFGLLPLTAPLRMNVGRHALTVRKPGYEGRTEVIDLPGGTTLRVSFDLHALAPPSTPPPHDTVAPPPRPPPSAGEAASEIPTAAWVGFGVAGAFAVAGTVTGVLAASKQDDVRSRVYTGDQPPNDLVEDQRTAHRLAVATDVLLAASLVTVGTTLYFTLTGESEPKPGAGRAGPNARWFAGIGPGRAAIGTRF